MSCAYQSAFGLAPGDLHRQEDVLLRGEHRQEVEELEDEADVVPAQGREPGVVEAGDLGVADPDLPAVGVVQPREDVHQGRLARARRPHDGRQLPGRHVEVHAAQGVDDRLALAVAPRDAPGAHGRVGSGREALELRQGQRCHGVLLGRAVGGRGQGATVPRPRARDIGGTP